MNIKFWLHYNIHHFEEFLPPEKDKEVALAERRVKFLKILKEKFPNVGIREFPKQREALVYLPSSDEKNMPEYKDIQNFVKTIMFSPYKWLMFETLVESVECIPLESNSEEDYLLSY